MSEDGISTTPGGPSLINYRRLRVTNVLAEYT